LKNRRWILVCSLLLNGALMLALAAGYAYYRFDRGRWDNELWASALYAGTMQAIADHENGRRRIYRLVPASSPDDRGRFTGETESGAEVWTRVYHPIVGEASRRANESFVQGYNNRMRTFLRESSAAATRPAD
jgi:hypothetical protein